MVFTSVKFIVFMAIVFALYYCVPKVHQWKLLLVASLVFYAFASPLYLLFLCATVLITYFGAIEIEKREKGKKAVLVVTITALLLMLGVFKYAGFLLSNFSALLGVFGVRNDFTLNLLLPLGLSFYMFQSMGYVIDVSREMAVAEKNLFKHALFVSYFPQLLQGPIGDYNSLSPQLLAEHDFSYDNAKFGLQRVAWGFFKKLCIANQIALMIDDMWVNPQNQAGLTLVFALFLYSFQLYADFSGYMDIALGCSQMLGITLAENFEVPYISHDIAEFWRKWHITLGEWFRNYVFYPILRGKKCSKIRKKYRKTKPYVSQTMPNVIALVIVWLLIGLWHGADWCYVVYGIFHGIFVVMATVLAPVYGKFHDKFPKLVASKGYKLFQVARTFLIVTFGYVIFRPADLSMTGKILGQITGSPNLHGFLVFGFNYLRELMALFVSLVILVAVDLWHFNTGAQSAGMLREKIAGLSVVKRYVLYVGLLVFIIVFGAYGVSGLNQFAYFKF